jgi:hypothetical protein
LSCGRTPSHRLTGEQCTTAILPSTEIIRQDSTGHRMIYPVEDEPGHVPDVAQDRCVEIDFPGRYQAMTHLPRRQTASGPISWMGSLMQDCHGKGQTSKLGMNRLWRRTHPFYSCFVPWQRFAKR